ncbi:MAG: DHH family phosphoesterase [Clostridia bacterium]|nr:DHH family phosphoesterase [Clostridia bacterium]
MRRLNSNEVASELRIKKSTLILCHKSPDPDTLGSAYGLKVILEHFGSSVKVSCADKVTKRLMFLTNGEDLTYNGEKYERIVAVDVASPSQLGELSFLCERVDFTIDHHSMCERFSDYYEKHTASCAEIIYEIAEELNILDKLPISFFESVYAGISGDTGCFRFSNVNSETLIKASKIIEHNIDHAEINRKIFDSKTKSEVLAQRLTYENMELYEDDTLSIICFTNEMKAKNNLTDLDLGDIINHIRGLDGVLVAVSLKQSESNTKKYAVSCRANADIDVGLVCAQIGGGGHKRAAGASIEAESKEEAISKVVNLFNKPIKDFVNGK